MSAALLEAVAPIAFSDLKLRVYPDPALKVKASPVGDVNGVVMGVALRMLSVMREHKGIGLAATQLGVNLRLIVVEVPGQSSADVMVNPVVRGVGKRVWSAEACLSHPGVRLNVRRFAAVEYEYINRYGQRFIDVAEGLLAACLQHEVDHLDGVSIVDKVERRWAK